MQNIETSVRLTGAAVPNSVQVMDNETHLYYEPCEESKAIAINDCPAEDSGRTLDLTLTLRGVCPGKRVAAGVRLTEMDAAGREYPRAFRASTVPAHSQSGYADITLPVMRFIMPEDISVSGAQSMLSGRRHFVLRTITHYVDTTQNTGTPGC